MAEAEGIGSAIGPDEGAEKNAEGTTVDAVGVALAAASLANDAIVAALASLLLQAPVVLFSRECLWRAVATGITGGIFEAARTFLWREWWEKRKLRRLR